MVNKAVPLVAMRAFESAARLGGFKAAAVELSVTPGAIAQHIKTLENWAGSPLFIRMTHGVKLTDLGKSVMGDFSDAFDCLGTAMQKLRDNAEPSVIRIVVSTEIAQLWLASKLPEIRAINPDISISITVLDHPPNLSRDVFDLSIFFRQPEDYEFGIEICQDIIFPVCTPLLGANLGEPSDLAGLIFLHNSASMEDWTQWLEFAAPGQKISPMGPSLPLYGLVLQESKNGAGIMMGHEPLVRTSLRDGSLIAPFPQKKRLSRSLVVETPRPIVEQSLVGRIVEKLCDD